MATILITGGTGLIGRAISELLVQKGHHIIVLTRNISGKHSSGSLEYANWDIDKNEIDLDAINRADYIIHLAGEGIADKRWSDKRKREIMESRTKGSNTIVTALSNSTHNVKAVIAASAIGWYGPDPAAARFEKRKFISGGFTEEAIPDTEFLGETCRLWEASIDPVQQQGVRLVKLRTGIALSDKGGALKEFKKPLYFGIAAILGEGDQVISWIHIEDLCRIYLAAIENEQMSGVYNAVAPAPVTNKILTTVLARQMKGKFYIAIHIPATILKIIKGELSVEVLKSSTVSSQKIQSTGFRFMYPTIESAIASLAG